MNEPVKVVCPRCGKTRSFKRLDTRTKSRMCQACATAIANRRRRGKAFSANDETVDDKLAELGGENSG
jgi:RNA polymerase-binding transcription factor DksA